jgi:RHS repeat-associated protein
MRAVDSRRFRSLWRALPSRWLAAAVVLAAVPILTGMAAVPPPVDHQLNLTPARPLRVNPGKPVPVFPVRSRHIRMPKAPASWHPTPARWPASGAATVRVAAGGAGLSAAGTRASDKMTARPTPGSERAGTLPVWVGPAARGGGTAAVRVTMASRAVAKAAGMSGVIFTLSSAAATTTRLHVSLSYSSFAEADGGSFGSRLRLVELPACALTTPKVDACRRQTLITSANDSVTDQLGADVTVAAARPAAASAAAGTSTSAGARNALVVLAATTSTSGSQGNYGATPLSDTGSWQAGGSSGAFDYSYPLTVPPVPGGLVPPVSIDYDSQELDGLTSATNDQASWIGDGFDYEPGFVERDYETCSQDDLTPALPSADKTGDLCWSTNNMTTLSLDGTTTTLVDDPTNGWHEMADDGAQITYRSSATSNGTTNGTNDGGYWIVTDPDGTSYYFGLNRLPGWASGDPTTNSAWTVPVYSPRSTDTDGCYNATFSKASCEQAWRWNLDYVTDPNGNAIAYFYNTETNYYGADGATTGTASYIQAGALATIWYGFRTGSLFSDDKASGAGEVVFNTVTTRTDIPSDLACTSGGTCDVNSPSFWSKYQLTSIDTYGLDGSSMKEADAYALTQSFVNPGDDTTTAPMVLDSVTRTGEDGTAVSLPPVSFGYESLVNRVETSTDTTDGYPEIPRERIESVTNETGEVTTVEYDSPPAACASDSSDLPTPDDNTTLCYPDYWTPPGASSPIEDWFNKYVVTMVTDTNTAGGGPAVVTTYCYGPTSGNCVSGAAWHYNDNALTRSAQRTWNEWRGFGEVTTETGTSPDPVTQTTDYYFQGMNGDEQSNGGTVSATVSQTIPGTSTTISVTDDDQWAGVDFAHIVYDGAGGSVVSDTVTTPWTSAATASQAQNGGLPDLEAYLTGTAETQTFTGLASGGYREADDYYTHDSLGRVITEADVPDYQDDGTGGDPSEDTCTQTTYATDSSVFQTDLPTEVTVTAQSPSDCPVTLPPSQSELISDTESYYDGLALGTADQGNLTKTELATSYTGSTENFTTQASATYDAYGRVTSSTDADGNTTTTSYSPSGDAEATTVTVTSPATANAPDGLVTTTTYDPLRELPLTVTNAAGWATSETYDALGQVTDVWTPGHPEATDPADYEFSYDISATEPSVVTTDSINGSGTYNVSEVLYNSAAQPVETQTETPSGGSDITDTEYNSDGWESLVTGTYYATGAPSTTLVDAQLADIPSETGYTYDGDGRVIKQIAYADGDETWETDTSYGGDYATVTPPAGGTAETTYSNGDGQTSYIYQYHSSPPPASPPTPGTASESGSSGWDETAYSYDAAQQLTGITDSAGNQWSYTYDLAGDQVSATTPDAGTTTSTYDADGNLLSTTNAAGSTVSYVYDADGRKTAEYAATTADQSASNEIASWTYDTLAKGQLTSSTSYTSGTSGPAYTEQTINYDAYGLPTGAETIIPSAAGSLAGTYKQTYTYNSYNDLMSSYYDYAAGGLPAEQVSMGYDTSNEPTSLTSTLWSYVSGLSYTDIGQPQEYTMGTTTEPAWLTDSYYPETGELETQTAQAGSTPVTVDEQAYNYDDDGLITSEDDTGSDVTAEDQCYTYDYLGELTNAWSQDTASCAATPSASGLGGAEPYWYQLTYDTTGDVLTDDATFGAPGSQTTVNETNTYHAGGNTGPHQLSNQTVASSASGSSTNTQAYNAAGQLTASDNGSSGVDQQYTWGGTDRDPSDLTSVTAGSNSTSYIYDADGNLLLQTDNGIMTLYLGDEQIVDDDGTLSGTRYYSIGGVMIAARTSAGDIQYLVGNQQGSSTVAIDYATLDVTRRYYNPWGASLQSSPPAFPGNKGFVGGTTDSVTGLTNLGAREYNPANGQFITTDPILVPQDPQDLNPYAYAANDPVSMSDPDGQLYMGLMFSNGCGVENTSCNSHNGMFGNGGGADTGTASASDDTGSDSGDSIVSIARAFAGFNSVSFSEAAAAARAVAGINMNQLSFTDIVPCGGAGGACYGDPYSRITWSGWTHAIGWASAAATGLALATCWIPGVDVVTGGLAVGADTLAGLTSVVNTGIAVSEHRYLAAGGYAVSAGLSFAGAGLGTKAVAASVEEASALSGARGAGQAFAALDHLLPEGAPALQPAALNYMTKLGDWQSSLSSVNLWGQAAMAMSVNEAIVTGAEWMWNRTQ